MNGKRWKENAKDITILEKPVLRCGSESPRKLLIPYCPVRPHLYIILAFLLRSTHNAWLAPAGFHERNLISDTHHLTFARRSCLSIMEDVAFDINVRSVTFQASHLSVTLVVTDSPPVSGEHAYSSSSFWGLVTHPFGSHLAWRTDAC